MIKIDLITGFLGAGKTTFIRKYAKYLMDSGKNIGILENDFGAVNVDMMMLQDLMGDQCELEMISGGCDPETHRRRFKTKLISMGMCGYDRILVEPSGIFDVDDFLIFCTKSLWIAGMNRAASLRSWMQIWKKRCRKKKIIFLRAKQPVQARLFSAK